MTLRAFKHAERLLKRPVNDPIPTNNARDSRQPICQKDVDRNGFHIDLMGHEDMDVDLEAKSTLSHVGPVLLVGDLLDERDDPLVLRLEWSGGRI